MYIYTHILVLARHSSREEKRANFTTSCPTISISHSCVHRARYTCLAEKKIATIKIDLQLFLHHAAACKDRDNYFSNLTTIQTKKYN